jgi:branched-chain amino acid transport system substrate-binding protein
VKKTLAVVLLLALGIALYLLLRPSGAPMARGSPDEILIGVAWPFAVNQDGMDKGLILAQEEINVRGLLGKRIRLLMRDDRMNREQSRRLAIEFSRNPSMVAAIGYYDDKFAVRASAIFEQSSLLHIVAGANNTYMTTHGFRYLIRSVLPNNLIARSLARLCTDRGYRNFAMVAEDGPFGEDLMFQIGTALGALNASTVYESTYVPGEVDFRETVDQLREAGGDAILFLGLEHEGAAFIKAARGMGLKTPIVGAFSDTPEMHEIAGPLLEGVMFYEIYDVNSPTPENRAFVARYRHRFGEDPEPYAAQGYDALRILAKAIGTTGSTNGLDLAYAIRYMDPWEGANGSYKFDSTGELDDKDLYLKMFRGGKPVVIATSHPVAPAPPVHDQLLVPY